MTKSVHFPRDDVNRKINRDSTSHIALFPGNYNYHLLMIFFFQFIRVPIQNEIINFNMLFVCLWSAVFRANIRYNASYRHFIEIGKKSQIWVDQFSYIVCVGCDDWPSYNDCARTQMGHDQSVIDVYHRYMSFQASSPSSYSHLYCISLWIISNSLPFEIVISCLFSSNNHHYSDSNEFIIEIQYKLKKYIYMSERKRAQGAW